MGNGTRWRPNLSDIAHDEIKAMILSGELEQGKRIRLDEMSERLDLGITPIREALNKLAQEDLVVITPRTSYEVVSLSAQDTKEILELRLVLETFALHTAEEYLARFPVQVFRELFRQPSSQQPFKELIEIDIKFHSTIIATST
ncbi:GntR family transcriptional regulator, partial [candidate division KSB3 bacterium]|nr:GntR family transcriptional regulator [candidate division KSB3 bacterium]MBD3327220.1 GntR family transcriptional regulator [candidate division KSB3 bacterium]